jgi:transposase-like protein
LKEWLFLAYLFACLHLSILKASREVERSYGIAYRSAGKVMHAIHKGEDEGGSWKLSGIIEMDEAYITAGLKGKERETIGGSYALEGSQGVGV